MDKRGLSDLGGEIKDIVQNAVNTRDFHQLNRDIGNTVNGALDEVRNALGVNHRPNQRPNYGPNQRPNYGPNQGPNQGPNYGPNQGPNQGQNQGPNYGSNDGQNQGQNQGQNWRENRRENRRAYQWENRTSNQGDGRNWNRQPNTQTRSNNPSDIKKQVQKQYVTGSNVAIPYNPVGRISGTLLTIFGNIGIGTIGMAVLILSVIGSLTNKNELFGTIVLALLPFLGGSMFMAAKGKRIRGRVKRFQRYLGLLHGRSYCLIKELSAHIGQSGKFIVKDLRKMITIGMFPEGHIDEQQTCLMLNRESYEQYLKTLENMRTRNLQEQVKPENVKREAQSPQTDNSVGKEIRKAIEEGRSYIRQIKEANEVIPGEEISKKLYRLEEVTSRIFNYVENHPEQLPEIQKFMEYYLPTTLKLLNAYKEFDNQCVQGDNISTAKNEIEKTLDTINLAFENLFDSLFEDAAMDISTDISVLETMLAQEGLTEKDFNSNRTMGG